ncbi:fimbrial protein [Advenella mimigardefordensis]|nr:fimbrial protein [Advenella mimigardefordensis]
MSLNATQPQSTPRLMPLFRRSTAAAIAITLALWSGSSHAQFYASPLGDYIISEPGNRFAIDEPIVFQRGANPVDLSKYSVFQWGGKRMIRAEAWSDAPSIPGRIATVYGQPHSVFRLEGLSTIGYVIDVKDPSSSTWLPINHQSTEPGTQPGRRITYQSPLQGPGLCCSIGLSIRITFIKLDQQPFTNRMRAYTVHNAVSFRLLNANDPGKVFKGPTSAKFSIVIEGRSSTCRRSGTTVQNIRLPDVSLSAFPAIGSTYMGDQVARFSLQCDPGITVFATLTDANNTSNTGDTLTNTGSAKGVGVQLLQTSRAFSTTNCNPGSPCRFGPDSSAKGNTNQWQISQGKTQLATSSNPSISFQARYVRTGAMQPGDVRAVSTITFSYQ